jgi:hypothetical protein
MCKPYLKPSPPRCSPCELLSKLQLTAKPVRSDIVNRRKRVPVAINMPLVLHRTANSQQISPKRQDPSRNSLGNTPRNILPVKTPNPRQRNINPRRNPTARPDIPINRPPGTRDPMRTRINRNNTLPSRLVRRSPHPRQQPRLSNDHRAGANRDQILQLRVRRLDILQSGVEVRRAGSGSTGD